MSASHLTDAERDAMMRALGIEVPTTTKAEAEHIERLRERIKKLHEEAASLRANNPDVLKVVGETLLGSESEHEGHIALRFSNGMKLVISVDQMDYSLWCRTEEE